MNENEAAGRYLPAGGEIVVVPARVAAYLNSIGMNQVRQNPNLDAEVRAVLLAFAVAEKVWLSKQQRRRMEPGVGEIRSESQLMTGAAAAKLLGISPRALRNACHIGHLHGQKLGNRWLITREDVERYRRERRPSGR